MTVLIALATLVFVIFLYNLIDSKSQEDEEKYGKTFEKRDWEAIVESKISQWRLNIRDLKAVGIINTEDKKVLAQEYRKVYFNSTKSPDGQFPFGPSSEDVESWFLTSNSIEGAFIKSIRYSSKFRIQDTIGGEKLQEFIALVNSENFTLFNKDGSKSPALNQVLELTKYIDLMDDLIKKDKLWVPQDSIDFISQVVDANNRVLKILAIAKSNIPEQSKPFVETQHNSGNVSEESDPLYTEAVAILSKTRNASISAMSSQLKIGYNRAAMLIENMEQAGLVSSMDSTGKREVLI